MSKNKLKRGRGPVPAELTWVPQPPSIPGVPPGLEYLTLIDTLLVRQKVEFLEALTGCETKNRYVVMNGVGLQVYYATEDSKCCTRMCCGSNRCFDMNIMDNNGREVIHLYRKLAATSCWFPCCLQLLEVCAPADTIIGYVKQTWTVCCPHFDVQDEEGETVLEIQGPFCTKSVFCSDVVFKVQALDGSVIGHISKKWSGFVKESFTDADNFGMNFPIDLDVEVKATLLGALFLIDYMFFETTMKKDKDGVGMMS